MTLKVVGSGLGRTGTKSLHTALATLGQGPCHHMVEVFAHPESTTLWVEAGAGRPNWGTIFEGYQSVVDYPGAAYWREIAAYYPDAKVLHSVRDPDEWFDSTQATIFAPSGIAAQVATQPDGPLATFFKSFIGPLQTHLNDRAYMTDHFRRHTEEVKRTIAPERLLVYEVTEGWDPLCAFLGVPVPDTPFPSENSRAQFASRVREAAGNPANLVNRH